MLISNNWNFDLVMSTSKFEHTSWMMFFVYDSFLKIYWLYWKCQVSWSTQMIYTIYTCRQSPFDLSKKNSFDGFEFPSSKFESVIWLACHQPMKLGRGKVFSANQRRTKCHLPTCKVVIFQSKIMFKWGWTGAIFKLPKLPTLPKQPQTVRSK